MKEDVVMSKVVFDKDRNQLTLIEVSDCRVYIRTIGTYEENTFTLPAGIIAIFYGVNAYNAGFVYIVQTGMGVSEYHITPIVETYHTEVKVSGKSLVVTSKEVITHVYYQQLGITS